jgi:HSP20 family molecular chaperone IbpA
MSTSSQFPVLLNVTVNERDNHCDIKADITGFRAKNVCVSSWEDSLIVEMQAEDKPGQSYYLGEVEPEVYRRVIPLGFAIKADKFMTHYQDGKLTISVAKRIDHPASAHAA